ncbi:1286_t:CDS:2 [Acaulospora colombiana]|uniref:1286_t:CDS:1 n=1 Tax=Acaulospora colombiana TaxID=27376 RepID=A0ACA9LQR9_9GLOM|nr:1286_t:CDS:2 [Acaulospora colombiana]
MASTNPYVSQIALATDPTNTDQSLIYDITDRVKAEGSSGANQVVAALKRRLDYPENGIKRRVLEILGPLIIECGSELHKALIDAQFFASLANIQDEEFNAALLEQVPQWKKEMMEEYHADLDRQLSRRNAGSLISRGVSGLGKVCFIHYRNQALSYKDTIHIARQALHLVIRLNDTVNQSEGPDLDQEQERIDLEDQLMDLEDEVEEWIAEGSSDDYKDRLPAIAKQYDTFFSKRFYFKLRTYDERTLTLKLWRERMGSSGEGDDQSEAYIESVHTSPALSQHREPIPIEKDLSLNQVNISLDPSRQTAVEGSTIASTSKSATDEIERAREFRQREAEQGNQEQNFTCPVPGCGKSFEKQYLLKRQPFLCILIPVLLNKYLFRSYS